MFFFVPPQGTIASFITLLSYNGAVQLAFLADERVVPQPHDVMHLFQAEYEKLRQHIAALQESGQLKDRLALQDHSRVHNH